MTDSLDRVLAQVDALPPAPQILPKLLHLLADPNTDISQITDLIGYDPGLTAKVLQLCNSAWLGNSTPATEIGEAVNRLGMRCIYRLVAAVNGQRALRPKKPIPGLDPETMWRRSVITALAAQFMAQDHHQDDTVVFTSALLHEAGKIVLAQAFKEDYGTLLQQGNGTNGSLAERERAKFGADHAEAGGRLLASWQFPEAMVSAVTCYHRPAEAGAWQRTAAYVHVADALACFIDKPSNGDGNPAELVSSEALTILDYTPEKLLHYRDRTLKNFEMVNAMFRL